MQELTILIPSYNRHAYLKRQIAFWGNQPVIVIILDGSDTPLPKKEKFAPNINYYHMRMSLAQRLAEGGTMIKTKFVILLADDELYIPSALHACVSFLQNNLEYSSCKGLYVGFRRNRYKSRIEAVDQTGGLRGYHVSADTPCKRVAQHFNPYALASIYAVHRTEVFTQIARLLHFERAYSCAASIEIQISLVVAWMGKIKVLDQLMWLRSSENPNITWAEGRVDTGIWLHDPKYSEEISFLVNDFLSLFFDVPPDPASLYSVKETLQAFAEKRIARLKDEQVRNFFQKYQFMIWMALGERVRAMLRPLLGTNQTLLVLAGRLMQSGVFVDMDELKNINSFLMNFDV